MSYYLRLNPNFDEAADDGEHVADDEQDIPAVDELHPVAPAHGAAKLVFEKLHILLLEGWKMSDKMGSCVVFKMHHKNVMDIKTFHLLICYILYLENLSL